jgi:hypothetical protein
MKPIRNERGIALAVAIFALVVVGGLVAGSLFVATLEQRVGRNTLRQQSAFNAAEAATQQAVLDWSAGGYGSLAVGGSVTTTGTATGGAWYRRTVRRLSQMLFMVSTEGFSADSSSRQRLGVLVRLRPLAFNINSALKTQGSAKFGGSSYINGVDTQPSGWTGCPATGPTQPAVRIPDPSQITYSGCSNQSCLNGDPKILKDTTISSSTLTTVGDIPFDSLRNYATKIVYPSGTPRVQPSLTGTSCNTSDPLNWGDPLNPSQPCGNYYPIVWVDGDVSINGVQGQGVLIVNGDLSVQGGFEFFGPVLVKGSLKTTGTGGHFNGGVIAANVDLEQNTVLGNAVVNYSSCALIRVLTATANGSVLRERSWVNLY